MSGTNDNPAEILAAYGSTIDVGSCFGHSPVNYSVQPANALGDVQRRFEAAETDRLNEAHWLPVSEDINHALVNDLKTLQQRCRHETVNNSVIDSGLDTHATNVVGSHGPTLQIMTENDAFNDLVEALWKEWASECEYQDGLSLVDLLDGWTGQWAFNGEMLVQEIVGKSVNQYRLHDLGAESFDNSAYSVNIFGGVEVDNNQRVTKYHVCDPDNPMSKRTLSKEFTLHCYRRKFAMQRRGIPSLASSLPTAADLRDYDDQVMDAARAAADYSILMVTDHPDATFASPTKSTVPIRRRTRQYAQPGWRAQELKANQPAITYDSFRKQRHNDIAGAIGEMPHMILRRDASNHNMSSARFDGSRYAKAIDKFQRKIERRILNFVVRRLVRIAQYQRILPPTPLNKITKKLQYEFPQIVLPIAWTWPKPPPVDALKDAMAQRIRMENGTLPFSTAVTEDGNRPDEVIRLRQRDNAALAAAGLPEMGGPLPLDPTVMAAIAADEAQSNTQPGANAGASANDSAPTAVDAGTSQPDA